MPARVKRSLRHFAVRIMGHHFIVGRDHSGVGNFYHPKAAQEYFLSLKGLGIEPIFFDKVHYCAQCRTYVEDCSHDIQSYQDISASRVRELLLDSKQPPSYLVRSQVSRMLVEMIKNEEKSLFEDKRYENILVYRAFGRW